VIDCDEWKTEKRHEYTNMGKVKQFEVRWQLYFTSLPALDVEKISSRLIFVAQSEHFVGPVLRQ
jgi:hypothetical protein